MDTRPAADPQFNPAALAVRRWASGVLYAALLLLALWTARDFLPAIAWAVVIALAIWPVVRWLDAKPPFRARPVRLAILLTALIAVVFVVPATMVLAQGFAEFAAARQWLHDLLHTGLPVPDVLARLPVAAAPLAQWWRENLALPLTTSPLASSLREHGVQGAAAVSVTREVSARLVHLLITLAFMLMTLFMILAAGPTLGERLGTASRRAFGDSGALLLHRMAHAARGTVVGLVVVGIGEGVLLGIAYLFAGLPHATLMGAVTALAAMVPFCAPLVFLGAAAWLLVNGSAVAALSVAIVGTIVVFAAEHFVRPALISGSTRLPFLLVLIGILGGAQTFGLLGLFIGPALMTVLTVLWETWVNQDTSQENSR